MSSSLTSTAIRREWGQLQRRAGADPGTAYVGHRTGQLALRFDQPVDRVDRVNLTACAAPGVGDDPIVYYHAVVHRVVDGRRTQQRTQFRHPFPAYDWLLERVPDFDLLETVYVNEPDAEGDAVEDSESTTTE